MNNIEIGDLVEVRKDKDLSPVLRFYHNKTGIVVEKIIFDENNDLAIEKCLHGIVVLMDNGRKAIFKEHELNVIAKACNEQ